MVDEVLRDVDIRFAHRERIVDRETWIIISAHDSNKCVDVITGTCCKARAEVEEKGGERRSSCCMSWLPDRRDNLLGPFDFAVERIELAVIT